MRGERLAKFLRAVTHSGPGYDVEVGPPPTVACSHDDNRVYELNDLLERRNKALTDLLHDIVYDFLPIFSEDSKDIKFRSVVSSDEQKRWRSVLEQSEEEW